MQAEPSFRLPSVLEVKREISTVVNSPLFRQAPKLRSLLEYVCHKALLHEGETATEYTIAIDLFGKPSNFKENKDSSVRVEVYRLRKRLAQFYETDGRDHPIRIIIPHGRYAPDFVFTESSLGEDVHVELPRDASDPASPVPHELALRDPSLLEEPQKPAPVAETALIQPARVRSREWIIGPVIVAILAFAAAAILLYPIRHTPATASVNHSVAPQLPARFVAPGSVAPFSPIRFMAGYSGPPRRDISGAEWGSDVYFHGGRPYHHDIPRVGRTNDPLRFQNSRIGDCTYDIPLPPGDYELHLYFVEPEFSPEVGRGENDRTFFLHLNDRRLMPAIDIESEAMGANIADERVFKGLRPAADGKLHIGFESATGVPLVNAIEILPGLPHAQLPVRLAAHPVAFTDHLGHVWQADNYYLNGQTCPRPQAVTGTPDPALFALERFGHFEYAIPVDVGSQYTVALHFAEFYFGPSAPGHGGVGSRVFNVTCNGVLILQDLDIFKEAGTGRALTKTAFHLKPSAQGKLNLTFEPVVNYALIYGIEVFDESK